MQKILMCPPTFFDVAYSINPWMDKIHRVDHLKAHSQWEAVKAAYEAEAIGVETITPVEGLFDMTFCANAGIVYGKTFISSNHRYEERKGEEQLYQEWFVQHGYDVQLLHSNNSGEGDARFYQNKLYLGWGFRSTVESHREIQQLIPVETVSLQLVNPYFFDLDTAFCPIGDKAILYYPEAFSAESAQHIKNLPNAIAIDRDEAKGFIGNSVLVNDTLFVEYSDPVIEKTIQELQIQMRLFDMSEFKKSGGGIKCITLLLDH